MKRKRRRTKTSTTYFVITNFLGEHQKIKNLFIRTGIVLKHGACDLKEVKNMAEETSLEEYKKAYREIVSGEEKRDFLVHLVVYVLVNAMLIAINFLYSPGDIWFFYPLIGWGIGISMHYLFGVRWIQKGLEEREAKAEYKAREAKRK